MATSTDYSVAPKPAACPELLDRERHMSFGPGVLTGSNLMVPFQLTGQGTSVSTAGGFAAATTGKRNPAAIKDGGASGVRPWSRPPV